MAPEPAVTCGMPKHEALVLLPIPSLDGLVERQLRGYVCVWGGEELANATAVNLGPRQKKRLGSTYRIFPRACPACVREAAIRALREHDGMCEQCTDDASHCDTRRALEELRGASR
ncbi:hypothetical protein [Streptomyces sp. NPDC050121]|uniref:hypothetical protein n=1 Tax=Streptomyces sp. NPDC050121 TaxID=3365601 RepID=UPI00378D1102